MAHREISARQALEDIRAGLDDSELMEKYRLSPTGLQRLYRQLATLGLLEREEQSQTEFPVRTVRIRELVKDVRGGLADASLVKKYGLSEEALHIVFKKLLDLKALTLDDLFGDESLRDRSLLDEQKRALDRYVLDFELTIFDARDPEIRGAVRDITEEGVGVMGMDCSVGEVRMLLISPDEFLEIHPFLFRAECRWCDFVGSRGLWIAGFRILQITQDNRESLRRLIRLLST